MTAGNGGYADDTEYEQPARDTRSLGTLGTVLLIVVVVVLVLLLWRSCGTKQQTGETESGGGIITSVSDAEYAEAGIAVWVKPGADIETVLQRNGLGDAAYSDFGEGTYVVSVDKGSAEHVVARLKNDEGLYDAGFVYTDPAAK